MIDKNVFRLYKDFVDLLFERKKIYLVECYIGVPNYLSRIMRPILSYSSLSYLNSNFLLFIFLNDIKTSYE